MRESGRGPESRADTENPPRIRKQSRIMSEPHRLRRRRASNERIICFFYYFLLFSQFYANAAPTPSRHAQKEEQPRNTNIEPHRTINLKHELVSFVPDQNGTSFRDLSLNAFRSLQGTPIEARLPAYHTDHQMYTSTDETHMQHNTRHHRKKNRRPGGHHKKEKLMADASRRNELVLDGRKHALMNLADPDGLRMPQKCEEQKFKQRVRIDGCLTKVVVNRLCHGTCASFFIPRMHSKKLKAAFKSCATCAPADYDFVDITLDCPGQNPPTATRTIVKVKSCKCREVSISSLYA